MTNQRLPAQRCKRPLHEGTLRWSSCFSRPVPISTRALVGAVQRCNKLRGLVSQRLSKYSLTAAHAHNSAGRSIIASAVKGYQPLRWTQSNDEVKFKRAIRTIKILLDA